MLFVTLRVSAYQGNIFVTQSTSDPDRSELRIDYVRTSSRMWDLFGVNQGFDFTIFCINNGNLV